VGQEVDLNKVRDLVKRGHVKQDDSRIPTGERLFVDRGKLVVGKDIGAHDNRALTRIDTETPFAGYFEDERLIVTQKFPRGATLLEVEGVRGWLYEITCELGTDYKFWTYLDEIDGFYKTWVLEPYIEEYWRDIHRGHIWVDTNNPDDDRNNRLCLDTRYNGGAPTLDQAFSRTVLWANGFSLALKTGTFPFST
jgi:hypothetical protein